MTYQNLGEKEKALKYFKRTFLLNPNLTSLKFDYANLLGNLSRYEEAKLIYDNAMNEILVAMQKLAKIEELYDKLPKLDCGSCGSPSCRALAEDIVLGYTTDDSCIVKFKEKIMQFASDMISIDDNKNI